MFGWFSKREDPQKMIPGYDLEKIQEVKEKQMPSLTVQQRDDIEFALDIISKLNDYNLDSHFGEKCYLLKAKLIEQIANEFGISLK